MAGQQEAELRTQQQGRADQPPIDVNARIAAKLREFGDLLLEQGADGFRAKAYLRAADVILALDQPLDALFAEKGIDGLMALPAVGKSIAAAIAELLRTGGWGQLERLRGGMLSVDLFRSLPGIGETLAQRLSEEGEFESLEGLEAALQSGDLSIEGLGPRRKRMLSAILSERLGRTGGAMPRPEPPPVSLLLAVDSVYRERAAKGQLRMIAPRRFNPEGKAWLPIMHASHGDWHFTVLFSNSSQAHRFGRTHDWVLIFHQRDGEPEGRSTVVTETRGERAGRRVVRGRENEFAHDTR